MSILPVDGVPENYRVLETPAPVVDVPSHAEAVAPPAFSEQQVRAIDGAFTHATQEQQTIAGLLGLRLSILLMHDLAMDAAAPAPEEEKAEDKPTEGGPGTEE